jgi:hypothetical protein
MKRKLINYDVFERIEKDSLSTAQKELTEAGTLLAKTLQLDEVELHCYGAEDVLYESVDGTFVHANYKIRDGYIEFDNVEELVINEETEVVKQKELISEMLTSVLENDGTKKADELFTEFLSLPRTRRTLFERKEVRVVPIRKDGKIVGYKKAKWETTPKHKESSNKTAKRMRGKVKKTKTRPDSQKKLAAAKRERVAKTLGEWAVMTENVFGYLDYKEYGPILRESEVKVDEKGNPVSVLIPTAKVRNEHKMLSFNWKTLNTDLIVKRNNAKTLAEDANFAMAIADLKRQNALSDNSALEEALEVVVTKWPEVIYLTQDELSKTIKLALEAVNATNYDDQVCEFMSEGILRMAHRSYVDRVARILKLAGKELDETVEDQYSEFKKAVDQFYPSLDESNRLEMQVFVDLYEALRTVHNLAIEEENNLLRAESAHYLDELLPIIQREVEPSLEVAEDAADYLWDLVETNLAGTDWNVSNTPHMTVSGDHPDMAKKARQGYAPASDFTGDWGDTAPASDGKSYKGDEADKMRNRGWGNVGGNDVYPSLKNPYVPEPFGDYKIKGEKTVDADSGVLGHWSSSDTWPNMQNPYVPQALTPQTDKMNQGKEEDLVVDQ